MTLQQLCEEVHAREGCYQEKFEALSAYVSMEQAAPLRTDLVQDATVILEGCPSGDEFAQACLVEQQACKTECLSEGAEQSQDSEHEPNQPEWELMSELSDLDQDELERASFQCEYCGSSLLPEHPHGQLLEYCQNEMCGMPSGMIDFADWASFVGEVA